ncbi:MAG: sigma-70 family RNA polymerase sigma factor [Candidatus Pacebacteria bacterium]|nr:sigma-70 family RNA polymerase sigma factor [Candidatus Paceibacterota bacterium]
MDYQNKKDIPFFSAFAKAINDSREYDLAVLANEHAQKTDRELIEAFLAGSEDCFAVLVERHLSMTYKFTYRYLNNADDTSDVVQEVFIKAWKHLKQFDPDRSFKTWLFTIAKNTALDFIKRKKPVLFSKIEEGDGDLDAFLAPYIEDADLPDEILERKDLKEELEGVLGELPPAYRTVLAMRYTDHLKFREIAEMLQEPIDTVKSKHRRGLLLLRKALGDLRESRT